MCKLQSFLRSTSARCLIMAGIAFAIIACVTIVFIVTAAKAADGCIDGLECLPISKCEGQINPDFIYSCGDQRISRICCRSKPKSPTSLTVAPTLSVAPTPSRIAKIDLLPPKCGLTPGLDRIANGVNASQGEFPWMALLGYRARDVPFTQFLCGGTLISRNYVLTAAHCTVIPRLTLVTVTLGELNIATEKDCYFDGVSDICSDDPLVFQVEKITPHFRYNEDNLKNDIALIRLKGQLEKFTDFIQPICLPFGVKFTDEYYLQRNFTISGWGKTSSSAFSVTNVLQYTRVKGWQLNRCNEVLPVRVRPIATEQICATGDSLQEACPGDSGGPLSDLYQNGTELKNIQLGIVSFKSLNTCGTEDIPTVFTRVDMYLDWILDNIDE